MMSINNYFLQIVQKELKKIILKQKTSRVRSYTGSVGAKPQPSSLDFSSSGSVWLLSRLLFLSLLHSFILPLKIFPLQSIAGRFFSQEPRLPRTSSLHSIPSRPPFLCNRVAAHLSRE